MSFLDYEPGVAPRGWITKVWNVFNTPHTVLLGTVRWYAPWRKYCFYPNTNIVLDGACLRDLATFLVDRTQEHRA